MDNQVREELVLFGLLTNRREQGYIDRHWPPGLPRDCTRLNKHLMDCIERGETQRCESCTAFAKVLEDATA